MTSSEASETKCIITGLLTSNPLRCTIKQLCDDFANTVGYKIPVRQLGFTTVEDYLRSIPDTVHVYGSGSLAEVDGVIKPKSAHINLMVAKQKKTSIPAHKRKRLKPHPIQRQPSTSGYYNRHAVFPSRSPTTAPYLLNPNAETYNPPQVICESPYSEKDVIQESTKETDHIECTKSLDSDYEQVESSSFIYDDEYQSKIPPRIQNNLRKLILQFPDGIWCTKLPTEYYKMFGKRISYEKYEYRSLIEMCSDLSDIFHYIQPSSDDFILYDKNRPIPSFDQNEKASNQYPATENVVTTNILTELPKLDWSMGQVLIPPDVLQLSDKISRYMPDDVREGDYLDISIGEIYDLSKFWVYMTFGELKPLMTDLQSFFNNQRNKYIIPELLLEEGLYCTTLYAGQFHRAVIVNLLPTLQGHVRVLFIDYGTVGNVDSREIWYLPKQFGKVPCQAMRARLSNIYPPREDSSWSVASLNKFRDLITNKALVGELTKFDKEENVLEIYLADITDQNHIFYINDVLVKKGYACYTDQEREKCLIDPYCIPNVKYIHLKPEFFEIESGHAPTSDEMNYIIASKIPMHHYMPQYFDIKYDEDIDYIEKKHVKLNKLNPISKISQIASIKTETNFDYSFFPDDLLDEIKALRQDETSDISKIRSVQTKTISQTVLKQEPNSDGENERDESFRQYFCNKKRISELIRGDENNFKNEYDSMCDTSVSNSSPRDWLYKKSDSDLSSLDFPEEEIVPLNNSLKQLNLNYSASSVITNIAKPYKPTNPFLSDEFQNDGNPFRKTNPFLNDIENTINKNHLFEIFAKSSEENLPEKIVNNLNTSTSCSCKINKQVNINKSNVVDNPLNTPVNLNIPNGLNNFSVKSSSDLNPFKKLEKKNETNQMMDVPRVRTPPGFSSVNSQNNALWDSRFVSPYCYNNYIPTNPYYQRFQQYPQFNNAYYPPNQLNLSLSQGDPRANPGYFNYVPQMFSNQYQFNYPYFQQAMAAQAYQQGIAPVNNSYGGNVRPAYKK